MPPHATLWHHAIMQLWSWLTSPQVPLLDGERISCNFPDLSFLCPFSPPGTGPIRGTLTITNYRSTTTTTTNTTTTTSLPLIGAKRTF